MVRSAQVTQPGGPLEVRDGTALTPEAGWVQVAVVASGLCRADLGTMAAREPGYGFPITPGHEAAGVITRTGEGVQGWAVGDRVAVGWFGGSCGHCPRCRAGDVVHCPQRRIPGVDYPGGWSESLTVPADALARIPDGLDFVDAAPLGCAAVTVFNALRRADLKPGGTVAVFGLGGLGHLAVLFAGAMGYRPVAITRGREREALAGELGAQHYIDTETHDPVEALQGLGGADLIVSTSASTAEVAGLLPGLSVGGRLTVVGVDGGDLVVPAAALVTQGYVVSGSLTGSPRDIEETMAFAVTNEIAPVTERMPLDEAAEAASRLQHGRARFRIVLETGAHP